MPGPNASVPLSLRTTAMAWADSIISLFLHKTKIRRRDGLRLRSWLTILLLAAATQYLRRTTSLLPFGGLRGGVPVELTHGNESAYVADGVTILDIIKRCPSLYGQGAKYVAPWWLFSYVLVCIVGNVACCSKPNLA